MAHGFCCAVLQLLLKGILKPTKVLLESMSLVRNRHAETHNKSGQWDGDGPEHPLTSVHITNIRGIHTEVTGHERKRQKYHGHCREHHNGFVVVVLL